MTEWTIYNGSEEQIAELKESLNRRGFITSRTSGIRWNKQAIPGEIALNKVFEFATEYLIIPDDPLREMKIHQAMTGQPVWVRTLHDEFLYGYKYFNYPPTTTPDWNLDAEYSFTEFKEEV